MEAKYLPHVIEKKISDASKADVNAPFSYLEWKQYNFNFLGKESSAQYERYLLNWFETNKQKPISQKFLLRQQYTYMLSQLQLYFTEEEKNTWYNKINFGDEDELISSIPFFAKKLKDISLYYLKLRKKIKNTKIKYNSVGTIAGIEQEIYRHLLETFVSSNSENDPAIQTILPSFSDLQKTLSVTVEELYDDNQYFDRSPTALLSSYVDIFHEPTAKFFLSKGIVLSSSQWAFESFMLPVTTNVQNFVEELTGRIFETPDAELYGSFIQKYLGETKFQTTYNLLTASTEISEISLNSGNNYFYYPTGSVDPSLTNSTQIRPISLSSLQITGATAGTTIEQSDTIFVKNGSTTKAAWLRYREYDESEEVLEAYINQDSTTSFIYPFAGYGLSGENLEWTGASIKTNEEYILLSPNLKNSVNEAYWSQALPADFTDNLLLANATLVDSGARATTNPETADNIYVRTEYNFDTTSPRGELSGAWLFKINQTSLPVHASESNLYLWPYNKIVSSDRELTNKRIELQDACKPQSVQEINSAHFCSSGLFEKSDKIYKLNNPADDSMTATECCWLSSVSLTADLFKYFAQDGCCMSLSAGEATRFMWTGKDDTPVEDVFKSVSHSKDCPFTTDFESITAFDWQKCSCKQVYYSPFGHPGDTAQDFNNHCDMIVEDLGNDFEPFTLNSWTDEYGANFKISAKFAWYKTNKHQGWGDGHWARGNGAASPLVFKKGKAYFYIRAASLTSSSFPLYNITYSHEHKQTKWVEAKKTSSGTWMSTNKESQMSIRPGDFIKVDRQANTASYFLTAVQFENVSENLNSLWCTSDQVSINSSIPQTYISWPLALTTDPLQTLQNPPTTFLDLSAILWWKIQSTQNPSLSVQYFSTYTDSAFSDRVYNNLNFFSFTPPQTGTYEISVHAVAKNQQHYVLDSTTIPLITAIPQYGITYAEVEFQTPTGGFLLEEKLAGWTYPDQTIGAKPYWAELYTNKDSNTKFKRVYSWGYPNEYVKGYLPNHAPKMSRLSLQYGSVVDYVRRDSSFWWNQPITYKTFVGTNEWSVINYNTTESGPLSAIFQSKNLPELVSYPTASATDIVLTNIINGYPVEIFYNALNSFVWSVSYENILSPLDPTQETFFENTNPYGVLGNRFFPTIATVPTLEKIYATEDVGGYFTPNYLGCSHYINKDFTPYIKITNSEGEELTEDTSVHIGGRGLTKQDQESSYLWDENNEWLKSPPSAGKLSGYTKKALSEKLQTFVPYQSDDEEQKLGLTNNTEMLSPWKYNTESTWSDKSQDFSSLTGVLNISSWSEQFKEIKKVDNYIDCWTTDIYGNQYGIIKKGNSDTTLNDSLSTFGQLWISLGNKPSVTGYFYLSSLFQAFGSNVLSELAGFGIKSVDCFYDTLMIQTSSIVLFSQIDFDFVNPSLSFKLDDTRFNLLTSDNFWLDQTWFHEQQKEVDVFFTQVKNSVFVPNIYKLDLTDKSYRKLFPTLEQEHTIVSTLTSTIGPVTANKSTVCYNNSLKQYLISYTGLNQASDLVVVNINLTNIGDIDIRSIDIFKN